MRRILSGKYIYRADTSPQARELIDGLLQSDVSRRLGCSSTGAEEIKGHPWFGSLNWSDLEAGTVKPPFQMASSELDTSAFEEYEPYEEQPTSTKPLTRTETQMFEAFDQTAGPKLGTDKATHADYC